MRRAAKCFINHLRTERNLSPFTIASYDRDINQFIGFVEKHHRRNMLPSQITSAMIQDYLEFLAKEGYAKRNQPVSRVRRLTTLRSWFKYLRQMGLVRDNPTEVVRAPKVQQREPAFLTEDECRHVLKVAARHASPFLAIRNEAIMATFLMTGLRLSELVSLNVRDVSLPRRSLRVIRKGGDEHTLPMSEELAGILRGYMRARRRGRRGAAELQAVVGVG